MSFIVTGAAGFIGMKAAGFRVVDQPQYFYKKSEGFRYLEQSAKNGALFAKTFGGHT